MILLLIYIEDIIKEMSKAEYHLKLWFHCHTAELYDKLKNAFFTKYNFLCLYSVDDFLGHSFFPFVFVLT